MPWAAAFASRPHGGLILLLPAVALFLAGWGFTTFWLGLLAGIAAAQIDALLTGVADSYGTAPLAAPGPAMAVATASWVIAATSGSLMLWLTPAVTAATPFLLVPTPLSALAQDIQRRQLQDTRLCAAEGARHQPAL